MNEVIMMGRLTKDPDVRYGGANNTCIAKFSLAVDRRFKRDGEPTADFFNCTSFGKQGEFVEKYLKKGTKIVLTGELRNDNYTNKEGQKVYGMQIVTNTVEFAESKAASQGSQAANKPNRPSQPVQDTDPGDGFMTMDGVEEDLPFN